MDNIVEKVIETKARLIRQSPVNSNRASLCGHPCAKYLVLTRTNWQDKKLHNPEVEFIFEAGRRIEEEALQELKDAGFKITNQNRDYQWERFNITGHLDAMIEIDGKNYPLEVKSMNQFDWEKINCIEDFLLSKKVWLNKYPAQLALYMLMSNSEKGLFYLKNKQSHLPKAIWMDLNHSMDLAEDILKRIELVNKHLSEKTIPESIEWDENICGRCDFIHICLPDRKTSDMELLTDPEFEALLEEREKLKEPAKRLDEIEKEIKPKLEGKKLLVGNFMIDGKWVETKEYTKVVSANKYWRSKIICTTK